ncbi:MAG: hypothetical protein K2U26_06190, partial [Cyclobacteriaceae bacterium]|nr:hypothetical protein [Cyclobacteriaceae bacterium]
PNLANLLRLKASEAKSNPSLSASPSVALAKEGSLIHSPDLSGRRRVYLYSFTEDIQRQRLRKSRKGSPNT